MRLKVTVSLADVKPQAAIGMAIADSVFKRFLNRELRVTSANDSTHKRGSLHGAGLAFDGGTREHGMNSARKRALVIELKAALGPEWDVILESEDGENEHIHFEWDPKKPPATVTAGVPSSDVPA